ncbi:hypothetical protein N7475_008199 [Penicillium sp. IBT 31633x]|nr:hypothetical protein N7475_008199 [Penicillium sp. IBT 31633x]
MASLDGSVHTWVENLVPNYMQAIRAVRTELETQIEILINHPGHQKIVSGKIFLVADSMANIRTLASNISVYYPEDPLVVCKRPGFFQTTFPRICNFIEDTLFELSADLVDEPESQLSVAYQLQDILEYL